MILRILGTLVNSSSAASTFIVRTSAMVLPRNLTARVSGVNRVAVAGVAGDPHIGQEVHLDPLLAGPLAGLATAPGLVEAEPPGGVAPDLGLGEFGEQLADQVVGAGIGDRGRGRRAAERGLVDADDLVDEFQPLDRVVGAGGELRPVQLLGGGLPEDVLDQRTLARAAHAGDRGDQADRERGIHILEVVVPGPSDDDGSGRCRAGDWWGSGSQPGR